MASEFPEKFIRRGLIGLMRQFGRFKDAQLMLLSIFTNGRAPLVACFVKRNAFETGRVIRPERRIALVLAARRKSQIRESVVGFDRVDMVNIEALRRKFSGHPEPCEMLRYEFPLFDLDADVAIVPDVRAGCSGFHMASIFKPREDTAFRVVMQKLFQSFFESASFRHVFWANP